MSLRGLDRRLDHAGRRNDTKGRRQARPQRRPECQPASTCSYPAGKRVRGDACGRPVSKCEPANASGAVRKDEAWPPPSYRNFCRQGLVPLLLLVPLLWGFDPFRSSNENVEEGNAQLGARKYKEALERYNQAAKELPDEAGVHYDRGIALYRLGKMKEAAEALVKGTQAEDRTLRAKSFYNLGNVFYGQKRYKEAAQAYKSSLRLRPRHRASKWNLELALRMIKEEQKKKDKKKDKDKDKKKDQKDQKDQKKQQQDQKDQKDQKKQQQDQKQQKDQKKQQQPQPDKDRQKPKPKPEQRQRDAVLDALDRSDKNLQKQRLKLMPGRGFHRPTKDW